MYKLCVFDLDGTIVYTIEDIAASLNRALEKNGFPKLSEREVQAIVGHSTAYMPKRTAGRCEGNVLEAAAPRFPGGLLPALLRSFAPL